MSNFLGVFRKKVNSYFENGLRKEELGKWANQEYYKILAGDYLIIEKLVCYKYLSKVANFHTETNEMMDIFPSTGKEIFDIREIINGTNSDSFFGTILIMDKYFDKYCSRPIEDFMEIKEIVLKAQTNCKLSVKEENKIKKIISSEINPVETVIELVELNIISMLRRSKIVDILDIFDTDPSNDFRLYVDNRKMQDFFYDELLGMLDCILGKKVLKIGIQFRNGQAGLFTISYLGNAFIE